jgi:hypothetical protein
MSRLTSNGLDGTATREEVRQFDFGNPESRSMVSYFPAFKVKSQVNGDVTSGDAAVKAIGTSSGQELC